DEDGNLTNEFLRYGGSVVISYIDKDGDKKELLLTLEDFKYDKTLNYENCGNRKHRMSYEENETERGERENIKRARFDELNIQNTRYLEIFSDESVSQEWYTLPHSDYIIHVTRNAPENELKQFKGKCSGNTSGNPGSNTGQRGNPTGGNTGGLGNSTGSNPNESGANKPNNSGSSLNQKQRLALDEIFKNLQMQRTNNDDNDIEELRKVSQKLAELLNMQNVNKK
ncbi:1656_t:CDS:2, partial [Dentiscutata erythropus]